MKAVKVYVLVWLFLLMIAGVVYFGGNGSETAFYVFGFVFSTLIFMGLTAVLPLWLDNHFAPKHQPR